MPETFVHVGILLQGSFLMPRKALLKDLDAEHCLGAELFKGLIASLHPIPRPLKCGLALGKVGIFGIESALDDVCSLQQPVLQGAEARLPRSVRLFL